MGERSSSKLKFITILISFILGLASLFCSKISLAEEGKITGSKAIFEESIFDFGTVSQGSKVQHDFVFKNEGETDLVVQRVVPACGCTAVTSSPDPIKKGGEGKIHVEFDTTGFSGEKIKTVRVYTNEVDDPSRLLTLKGVVESDVEVEPRSLFFEGLVRGVSSDKNAKVLSIKLRKGSPAKISTVKSYSDHIVVQELSNVQGEKTFSVTISPEAPRGELRDRIIVGIAGAKESSITVPVFASIKGQISVKPAQISFGILEGDKEITRSVKFENVGDLAIHIKEVKSDSLSVQAKIKEIEVGKKYVIQISVDPKKVTRDLKASVDIITDNEQEGIVSLNVYGILPPKV